MTEEAHPETAVAEPVTWEGRDIEEMSLEELRAAFREVAPMVTELQTMAEGLLADAVLRNTELARLNALQKAQAKPQSTRQRLIGSVRDLRH